MPLCTWLNLQNQDSNISGIILRNPPCPKHYAYGILFNSDSHFVGPGGCLRTTFLEPHACVCVLVLPRGILYVLRMVTTLCPHILLLGNLLPS